LTGVDAGEYDGFEGGGLGYVSFALAQGLKEAGVDIGTGAAERPPVLIIKGLLQGALVASLTVVSTRRARCSLK
jgi:hypothetical protein